MPTKLRNDCVVTKSISIPITMLENVLNEADMMNKSFSETLVVLLRLGISAKKSARESLTESEQKILLAEKARQ